MLVENTLDEVLLAATMGGLPSDEDVAAVTPPPGREAAAFGAQVRAWAQQVVDLRRAGQNGQARRLASQIADDYVAAFDTARPKKAGDAASPQATADATPAELAARVATSPNFR